MLRDEGLDKVTDYKVDRGGLTKWGITRYTLAAYQQKTGRFLDKRVGDLTRGDALEIYYSEFWKFEAIDDERLAKKLLTIYVNHSPPAAVRIFQLACNDAGATPPLTVDGLLGPATITALNTVYADLLLGYRIEPGRPDAETVGTLIRRQIDYYVTLVKDDRSQIIFLAGWLNRAVRVPA